MTKPVDDGAEYRRIVSRGVRTLEWARETFGEVALDPQERALRFLEEAMELAQAAGTTGAQAAALLERTWSRPPGLIPQEAAQVQLTLELVAEVLRVDLDDVAERELARITR